MRQARHLRRLYAVARILGVRTALTVLAVTFIVGACGGGEATPIEPTKHAAALTIVSGDGQTGEAGTQLAQALVVEVTDDGGAPLAGQSVTFIAAGGGSVSTSSGITDARGHAQTLWTLGTSTSNKQTLSASVDGDPGAKLSEIFHASALPGPARSLVRLVADGQTARPRTVVSYPPAVRTDDQYGNPVPNVPVDFAITSGGGSIVRAHAVTDSDGVATVDGWTLGSNAGANTLTATAAGSNITGNPTTFTAFAGSDFWTSKAAMPSTHGHIKGAALLGNVYVVGTNPDRTEVYSPATDSWLTANPLQAGPINVGVGVANDVLYAIGGIGGNVPISMEAFSPRTGQWLVKTPMPTPRTSVGVGVINGIIYVVGGEDRTLKASDVVEAYDPTTDRWTTKAPMPAPCLVPETAVLDGILYVLGQSDAQSQFSNALHAYDPATDTWTVRTPAPSIPLHPALAAVGNTLVAVGGFDTESQRSHAVSVYDPLADTWTAKAPMPTARSYPAIAVINGVLYVMGGDTTDSFTGSPTNVAEAYQP